MRFIEKFILLCTVFLAVVLFFVQCGKEDPGAGNEPVVGTVTINPASFNSLPWDTKQLDIQISWSKTTWRLAKSTGDIIESISVVLGGNASSNGETAVKIKLYPNTSSAERSQELLLTNFSTKEIIKLKITQQSSPVSTKITLNPSVTFQKVTGFGGMLNPSWTGNNLRDAEVQKLYGDLGFNIIRMMLYPNQSDWGLNTATAKKAQSLGAIVFASPWTPPK